MAEDAAQRSEVCRRHGISEGLAGDLHGTTPAEWEADAAARAAIARMFGGGQPEPEEQPEATAPEPEEPKPLDPAQLAAQSKEESDKAFIAALLAPKRREVELLQMLGIIDAEPEEES